MVPAKGGPAVVDSSETVAHALHDPSHPLEVPSSASSSSVGDAEEEEEEEDNGVRHRLLSRSVSEAEPEAQDHQQHVSQLACCV